MVGKPELNDEASNATEAKDANDSNDADDHSPPPPGSAVYYPSPLYQPPPLRELPRVKAVAIRGDVDTMSDASKLLICEDYPSFVEVGAAGRIRAGDSSAGDPPDGPVFTIVRRDVGKLLNLDPVEGPIRAVHKLDSFADCVGEEAGRLLATCALREHRVEGREQRLEQTSARDRTELRDQSRDRFQMHEIATREKCKS